VATIAEFRGVTKEYRGVPALENVDFSLAKAEIHSLVGENGAGKSTLTKIMAGVIGPTSGEYLLDGKLVHFRNPSDGLRAGIAMVHQETSMVPAMTVAQNLYLGREPAVARLRGVYISAHQILQSLNFPVDPRTPVQQLGAAHRQMVEIARAVLYDARIIIFDEPTATLTPEEKQHFFDLSRRLRDKKGVSIVFISHALEESLMLSDRITILRDGRIVGTGAASSFNRERIVAAMTGRQGGVVQRSSRRRAIAEGKKPTLEVKNLKKQGLVKNTSFSIYPGEVTGIFGLVGSGRTELARILCGDMKRDLFFGGRIYLRGQEIRFTTPREAIRKGIIYITEDRKYDGIFETMSAAENIEIGMLAKEPTWKPGTGKHQKRPIMQRWIERLSIKAINPNARAIELSGGNQQKCMIAKSLVQNPQVAMFDEPTRGVDVGAIAEIHELIADLAEQGTAVVVISSYLPEIMKLSDRILVMRQGRVVEAFAGESATEQDVLRAAVH
jgi:simple sugar transport system ATP-binding protein